MTGERGASAGRGLWLRRSLRRSVARFRPDSVRTDVDPLIAPAAPLLGGLPGRYVRWNPTPWHVVGATLSMLAAVTTVLGVFQKSYCLRNGWGVPEVFWRACYVDMPYLFTNTQLATGDPPYPRDGGAALAQPFGTGLMLWLTSMLVPDGDPLKRQQVYVGIWVVLLTAALIALVLVTAATLRHRPWAAIHVAASPLIVTVALVSPDLIGILLASAGLLAWSRGRLTLAGVAFGLAIATRTYPLLLVIVLGLLAWRAGRIPQWAATAGAALLTWGGILIVTALPTGWSILRPYEAWFAAGSDYGSPWFLLTAAGVAMPTWMLTLLAILGWGAAVAAGAALSLVAPARPFVAEVAIVVLVIVIATGKSIPVQTTLWLLPLVGLAGLRWRDHLIWASCEVTYFVAVWLYLGGLSDTAKGLPVAWYAVFTVVRLLGLGYLAVTVWRRAMARIVLEEAPGETDDIGGGNAPDDDPSQLPAEHPVDDAAGPLAGSPDHVVVTIT